MKENQDIKQLIASLSEAQNNIDKSLAFDILKGILSIKDFNSLIKFKNEINTIIYKLAKKAGE